MDIVIFLIAFTDDSVYPSFSVKVSSEYAPSNVIVYSTIPVLAVLQIFAAVRSMSTESSSIPPLKSPDGEGALYSFIICRASSRAA